MSDVEAHYGRGDLRARIEDALQKAGLGDGPLDPDELALVEEFHTLGRPATIELAELAGIDRGAMILDVGAGIGGPARLLARRYEAIVTGIDVTAEFCQVATWLSKRTGLSDHVTFHTGDALALPFDDASFDVVWTQHVTMNVADKGAFYGELRRVTRPGGKLAFFDLMAGPVQPIHFPVPWADTPGLSFLEEPEEMMGHIRTAFFQPQVWNDLSDRATEHFRALATGDRPPPPVSLRAVLPDLNEKTANVARNFDENRLRAVQGVCEAVV